MNEFILLRKHNIIMKNPKGDISTNTSFVVLQIKKKKGKTLVTKGEAN